MNYMPFLITALCIAIIVLLFLFIRQKIHNKELQKEYDELDSMLTHTVSDNLDMEKKIADIRNDYNIQQEMAEEIQRIQTQMRLLKHDMKNHTMVMLSYFEENKIDEAKNYAGEILDKLNRMYTYVNIGNSLLNYIINNKLSQAKEAGCEIKAEVENLSFDYMDAVDFSALFNNVLDNAIKGALDSEERKLEIKILSLKGMDTITVRNSIDASVLENNPDFISTKNEPGHGYGIAQIKNITQKYKGDIEIYEKNNMFIVSIVLG